MMNMPSANWPALQSQPLAGLAAHCSESTTSTSSARANWIACCRGGAGEEVSQRVEGAGEVGSGRAWQSRSRGGRSGSGERGSTGHTGSCIPSSHHVPCPTSWPLPWPLPCPLPWRTALWRHPPAGPRPGKLQHEGPPTMKVQQYLPWRSGAHLRFPCVAVSHSPASPPGAHLHFPGSHPPAPPLNPIHTQEHPLHHLREQPRGPTCIPPGAHPSAPPLGPPLPAAAPVAPPAAW